MGRNAIETVLGAVVIVVAGLFMTFAYSSADLQKVKGYTVNAHFPMVDGIKDGTDVKVNGVKVGSVSSLTLITDPGPDQYKVNVKMTLLPSVILPMDTIAMVASEGLLGGKYMALEIGVDEETIETDGTGRVTHTQAPLRLDDLIGQLIYSKKSESGKAETGQSAPSRSSAAPSSAPPSTAQEETPAIVTPSKPAQPSAPPQPKTVKPKDIAPPPAEALPDTPQVKLPTPTLPVMPVPPVVLPSAPSASEIIPEIPPPPPEAVSVPEQAIQ